LVLIGTQLGHSIRVSLDDHRPVPVLKNERCDFRPHATATNNQYLKIAITIM